MTNRSHMTEPIGPIVPIVFATNDKFAPYAGVGYTIRHGLFHLGLWKDEEWHL